MPSTAAETDASGNTTAEYIFFGGKRIAMLPAGGNPIYYVEDLLGTSRVIASNSGVVCYDADFYPYGGERSYTNTCPQNYKFEGKERDTETGNDDFGARYYSNRFGRFMSPDWSANPSPVPFAELVDPQTLNLYSYTRNNPINRMDPSGHCTIDGEKHGFWWCFAHVFGATETQKEYNTRINTYRQWLISNVAQNPAQSTVLRNASASQVEKLYWQWSDSLEKARCGGFLNYCETVYEAKDFQRASDGSFVPLVRLHSDSTITQGNSAGYQYWSGKSTSEIIESLKPGAENPLTVRPNGTILDGNTRIKILEERGIDINKLERVIIEKVPLDPLP